MPSSKIPSPARSLGVKSTPRRYKHRRTRSVSLSAKSGNSIKLTALLPDSFVVSPLPKRRSVLTDDTDVDIPKRQSWWKKLDESSTDVIEFLEHKDVPERNNIEENFDVEILSQEKKKNTVDLPESSDGESISSIVIPQRKLFAHKENQPLTKFPLLINNREESAKLQESHVDHDKEIEVCPRSLFNNAKKQKTKPIFQSALLNISTDKSVANKTKEMPAVELKGQIRNLFGNCQGNKRKNIFADFIVSESEDEIPEIQTKVFGFQKKNERKRRVSATSGGLQHSPNFSIVDIDMDDWAYLPSSTMVDNQVEEQGVTPSKRTRLSEVVEPKEMDTINKSTKSNNRSKQSSSSKAKDDVKELINSNNVGANKTNELNKTLTKSQNDAKKLNKSNDNLNKENSNQIGESQCNSLHRNIGNNEKACIHEDNERILSKEHNSDTEDDFTLEYDNDEDMQNNSSKSEKLGDIPNAELEGNKIERDNITNKLILADIDESKELHSPSTSKSLNKSGLDIVPMDCDNDFFINKVPTNSNNSKCLHRSIDQNDSTSKTSGVGDDENHKKNGKSTNEIICNQTTTVNKTDKDNGDTSAARYQEVNETDKNDEDFVDHNDSKINRNKKVPESEDYGSKISKNIDIVHKTVGSQSLEAAVDHIVDHEVSRNLYDSDVSKIQERNDGTAGDNNELSQSITELESEQMQGEHSDDESQEQEVISENDNESDKSQNEEEIENDSREVENDEREIQSAGEIDIELDNHHESNIDHDNNEQNEGNLTSYHSKTEIRDDASTKEIKSTSIGSENKKTHETKLESPEVILNKENKNLIDSFILEDRNSPRKTKSMFKQLTLRPSLAPVRESIGFSDNTENSSANSVWDSHRVTRKTLRKTFGKDFTPRKSLRTLVMEKSAKRQTFNPDLKDLSKHPHANSTELPVHDDNEHIEDDSVENNDKPMEVSSDDEREAVPERGETIEEREETVEETEDIEEEMEEAIEEREETVEEREESVEEREESVEDRKESVEEREESVEESEESVEEREESVEESEESLEEREESVEEREEQIEEIIQSIDEMEESEDNRGETIEESVENIEVGEEIIEERNHELSKSVRQQTLEMYLQKIKRQELERSMKIREKVINSLKVTTDTNFFKYPNIPVRHRLNHPAKQIQRKPKPKVIQTRTLNVIPEEVLEDLKYKPPQRFRPRNASWATKRLYKFLESKLEPKYDYMARVRAEKLVETIYEFTKQIRRHEVAPHDSVASLKREMARLKVVDTHYEFYDFFHEYMPTEVIVKVNPDPVNRIQPPRDVFANIIQ